MYTLNCKGKLLPLQTPLVMGILNATPDSFYKGNLKDGVEGMTALAEKMIKDGADIIDIGGQSTKPGSKHISVDEEIARILPVIKNIIATFPDTIISVDTYYSEVASQAVIAGASIVNDISGGEMDKQMLPVVASLNVPYILMHIQGTPDSMQNSPSYENVVMEILDFFKTKIAECTNAGIKDIIIDPGFGFGKTIEHNFEILQQLSVFGITGKPVLAGISRKSMINTTLNILPEYSLNGTTVLNTIALMNGASILRVHDVKEAKEVVMLYNKLLQTK